MKLKKILNGVYYRGNVKNIAISNVTESLENVVDGSLFVAVRGRTTDGTLLIDAAFERGAAAVVYEIGSLPKDYEEEKRYVGVTDTRRALSLLCANFYNNPAKKLFSVAVTGTNGKTTTATMLWHILNETAGKTGLIGTVSTLGAGNETAEKTTPQPQIIQRMLSKMVKNRCKNVVMEASSQGLYQKRLEGIMFDIGIFTNFSTEHMDYHLTRQEYFNSKFSLCSQAKIMLVNKDDETSGAFFGAKYFSANEKADFYATDIILTNKSISFNFNTANEMVRVRVPVVGRFNVYNALAALSAACLAGVDVRDAAVSLLNFKGVAGRQEYVDVPYPFDVIIDFAHTPKSLEEILKTLKPLTSGRLICVFGCGGDRDKTKRPMMGKTATELADFCVITSDNPRTEAPEKIIEEIVAGIDSENKDKYTVIADREKAIHFAVSTAKTGDIVLVAGKGHEKYQIVGTEKIPFDEKEIIKKRF